MRPFDIFLLVYVAIWVTTSYGLFEAHNTGGAVAVFFLGLLGLFFLLWLRERF